MKKLILRLLPAGLLTTALSPLHAAIDPRTNSLFTTYSAEYARIYATDADKMSGNAVATWSRGAVSQSNPAYVGVHEVYSSASWVYIRASGLGIRTMGPWYLNAGHTTLFPNVPINTKTLYRIPRTPVTNTTHTLTGGGAIGYSAALNCFPPNTILGAGSSARTVFTATAGRCSRARLSPTTGWMRNSRTADARKSPARMLISGNSRRRHCAMSHSRHPICTTDASVIWRKWWRTTARAFGAATVWTPIWRNILMAGSA